MASGLISDVNAVITQASLDVNARRSFEAEQRRRIKAMHPSTMMLHYFISTILFAARQYYTAKVAASTSSTSMLSYFPQMQYASPCPFAPHYALYPRTFYAPRAPKSLAINGDLSKEEWSRVPWSDTFDDICGHRNKTNTHTTSTPPSTCQTRMKMQWDDTYLYIGAMLHSYNRTVISTFTKRNSPIFHSDSDFEVFIDAASCCHNYKEMEMNAYNTVWNLLMDKPYPDGGVEHSGRVANRSSRFYWDTERQLSATRIVWGKVNDDGGAVWTVEIALAHSDTLSKYEEILSLHQMDRMHPKSGRRWRINFSRVEAKGNINWTWQPQIVWDATLRKHVGKVNMHLPDAWGYVEFVDSPCIVPNGEKRPKSSSNLRLQEEAELIENCTKTADSSWPAKLAAMNVYYAELAYKDSHDGKFTSDMMDLKPFLDEDIMSPFHVEIHFTTKDKGLTFFATISPTHDNSNSTSMTINNERFLVVVDDAKIKVVTKDS